LTQICLSFLDFFKADLLKLSDIADVSHFFQQQKKQRFPIQEILVRALSFEISEQRQNELELEYFCKEITLKLGQDPKKWEKDEAPLLSNILAF